jgi:hypothetical protein
MVPSVRSRRPSASGLATGALFAAALALRLLHVDWGLPDVYEEATPLRRAWEMAGWGPGAELDANPGFFRYPSLVIYLHLLGLGLLYAFERAAGAWSSVLDLRVAWEVDPTPFFSFARGITAVFGAATVAVTYRLGRRVGGTATGLAASILLAIAAFHLDHSRRIEVDVPMAFFVTWALDRIVRAFRAPSPRAFAVAGALGGLAASAKYPGAFVLVPLVAAATTAPSLPGRRRAAAVAAGLAGAAVAFALTSPYVLLDFSTFRSELASEGEHMRAGHFGADTGPSWGWYLRALGSEVAGWPAAVAAVLAAGWAFVRLARGEGARAGTLALPALYLVTHLAIVGAWSMKAEWYLLPVLPATLVLAARGLVAIADRAADPPARRATLAVGGLLLAAPALLALPARLQSPPPDPRSVAREWIEANAPAGALVLTEAYGPPLLPSVWRWTTAPDLWEEILARRGERPEYAIQHLPMFQVRPERSTPFYDPALLADVDLVVTTADVGDRYRREPTRFPRQLAFYRHLEENLTPVHAVPAVGSSGESPGRPAMTVWFNPAQRRPFGWREEVDAPPEMRVPPGERSGSESEFLIELALNYETMGFVAAAREIYGNASRYPRRPGRQLERKLVTGLSRCLLAEGDTTAAIRTLETAARQAREPGDREVFLEESRAIRSGGGTAPRP